LKSNKILKKLKIRKI